MAWWIKGFLDREIQLKHNGIGHCDACNVILTPYEMSMKDLYTGEYVGLCGLCCKEAELTVAGNPNLLDNSDTENYFDDILLPDEDDY